MILDIETDKEVDERWFINIDVTPRLATAETIIFIEGFAKIYSEFESRKTVPLAGGDKVVVQVFNVPGQEHAVETQFDELNGDSVQILLETDDDIVDNTVWDAGATTIAGDGKSFDVVIQGGTAGNSYELDLNVKSDSTPQAVHKVRLRWNVI